MRGATLIERFFHWSGYHYRLGRHGIVRLTDRYFRLQDRDVFSVRCIFCDEEVKNPFHKM